MHRFFVPKDAIKQNKATLSGSDVHQIRDVLRLSEGSDIELLDGTGNIYAAKIKKLKKDEASCDIISYRESKSEPNIQITVIQSLPKGPKMDMIVQKMTEIGAHKIIPVISERTIVKLSEEKEEKKVLRWQKIAKEASEQSARGIIPHVEEIKTFEKAIEDAKNYDLALIPWEMEDKATLKNTLNKNKKAGNIVIAIGPEGGFSKDEIEKAKKAGFISISLGKRILRTETAGIVVLAEILYEFEG